jgi:prevent-host-death family protein
MKQVTVRELQQNICSVLQRVRAGEVIEVTRRRKAVARILGSADEVGVRQPEDRPCAQRADRRGPRALVKPYFDTSAVVPL